MQYTAENLKWDERGLIPAIIQQASTGEVLSLVYLNKEALERTIATGKVWMYSRSRGRLAQKGETSGHVQLVESIQTDCDQDTLLIRVQQVGPGACHQGFFSCFHYDVSVKGEKGTTSTIARTFDPEVVYGAPKQRILEE